MSAQLAQKLSLAVQAVQNLVREHAESLILTSDGVEREFFVSFVNVPQLSKLRQLKAMDLGRLVAFTGQPATCHMCPLFWAECSAVCSLCEGTKFSRAA